LGESILEDSNLEESNLEDSNLEESREDLAVVRGLEDPTGRPLPRLLIGLTRTSSEKLTLLPAEWRLPLSSSRRGSLRQDCRLVVDPCRDLLATIPSSLRASRRGVEGEEVKL